MPDDIRQKIRDSKKGKSNGRLGYQHSEETKEKMRQAALGRDVSHLNWTGRKHTLDSRKKITEANLKRFANGKHAHPMYGKSFSEESKHKMRMSHLGHVASEETRKKLSEVHSGPKHWNWQGGITSEDRRRRGSREWKLWRKYIFERDNFTCQECGVKGGTLEPHHIIPVRSDKSKLFDTKNGITLCRPCHQKTIWKEHLFEGKYLSLTCS